jgi:hypothetical protein
MTDYKRMERHIRYNRIATWTRIIAVTVMVPEVFAAITYHFPLWDDIAMPLTLAIHQAASFIQRHTGMYRVDL